MLTNTTNPKPRLAALKLLADSGIVNKDSNYVLVEVFPLDKEIEVGVHSAACRRRGGIND
jgi:hypothetical protein